jgi:hypothetical protein
MYYYILKELIGMTIIALSGFILYFTGLVFFNQASTFLSVFLIILPWAIIIGYFLAIIAQIIEYRGIILAGLKRPILNRKIELHLPARFAIQINKDQVQMRRSKSGNLDVTMIIGTRTRDFDCFFGSVALRDNDEHILGEITLEKIVGVTISLFGESFTDFPHGKTHVTEKIKWISISIPKCPDVLNLTIDLDWNFRGWKSRREREIPADAKANFDAYLF